MPLNLFAICPSTIDATSLYRGIGPLGELKRRMDGKLQISILPSFDWAMLNLVEALFVQRPYRPQDVEFIRRAKAMCRPVWVDYDDDLLHVLPDNPAFHTYSSAATQKNVAECVALADVVTVSTQKLYELWQPIAKKIVLIPNAHNDAMFGLSRPVNSDKKHVVWRGGASHMRDLWMVRNQLIEVADKHPDWKFTFIGYNPWFITEEMGPNQAIIVPAMDPIDYFAFLRKIEPRLFIAPLFPSEFNAAKSNIAWMEATYAGAGILGPNLPEWKRPGVFNYSTSSDFKNTLDGLLTHDINFESQIEESWQFIQGNLLLSGVNAAREEVVNYLAECMNSEQWREESRNGRGDRALRAVEGNATGEVGEPASARAS